MKRHVTLRWFAALCVATIIAIVNWGSSPLTPTALAARVDDEVRSCSVSRLRGAYVISINGFLTSQQAVPQFSLSQYSPASVFGKFVFDGEGNVSRSLTVSAAGEPPNPVADMGSYQVNPDCSGSATFPTNSETFGFNLVDLRSIAIVTMTPGEAGAGTLTKQEIRNCSPESLQGVYVNSVINGFGTILNPPQQIDGFFPVNVAGSWTFDGQGKVSRSLSLNFAGAPGPYLDSGRYQVNSDCSASTFFPNDNEPIQLILIDSRKTVIAPVSFEGIGRVGTGTLVKQSLTE